MIKAFSNLIRLTFVSTLLASSYTLLSANKSLAWFEVCNHSQKQVKVAFSYLDVNDNRHKGSSESEVAMVSMYTGWQTEGWYVLNPKQCVQTYPHELWRRNAYYYVYAKSTDGQTVWEGKQPFCIDSNHESFHASQRKNGMCSRGENAVVKFHEAYIGRRRVKNYTFYLDNRP